MIKLRTNRGDERKKSRDTSEITAERTKIVGRRKAIMSIRNDLYLNEPLVNCNEHATMKNVLGCPEIIAESDASLSYYMLS